MKFLRFLKGGDKPAETPARPGSFEAYAEALESGWVPPHEGQPQEKPAAPAAEADEDLAARLARFYRNQDC